MNSCKIWGEPWYGKNSGLVQHLAARPANIELAGSFLVTVPGPIALQVEGLCPACLLHEPQRAGRRQDQAQRIGPYHPLDLAALLMPKAREGVAIADRDFHGPPLPIVLEDRPQTQREVSREESLDERG